MRTMVVMDDAVHRQAKTFAARLGCSLSRLVEEGLRIRMSAQPASLRESVPALPVFRGKGGVRPGVDLDDGQSVQEALDAGRSFHKVK